MKKQLFTLLFITIFFSCQNHQKISDIEVKDAFYNLFDVLDNDPKNFGEVVTDDFLIFENSKRYNIDEFIEFVTSFDIIESERKFKNLSIDTDANSAHITLDHHGEFLINTPNGKQRLIFDWLESAYLIRDGKSLKFKFYFSEAIKDTIISL